MTQNLVLLTEITARRTDILDVERSVIESDDIALFVSRVQRERSEVISIYLWSAVSYKVMILLSLYPGFRGRGQR